MAAGNWQKLLGANNPQLLAPFGSGKWWHRLLMTAHHDTHQPENRNTRLLRMLRFLDLKSDLFFCWSQNFGAKKCGFLIKTNGIWRLLMSFWKTRVLLSLLGFACLMIGKKQTYSYSSTKWWWKMVIDHGRTRTTSQKKTNPRVYRGPKGHMLC